MDDRGTIYLDHNATTPAHSAVIEAMLPWLRSPSNASSAHALGRQASDALEGARTQLAAAVGSPRSRIYFTSGATEANNLILRSVTTSSSSGRRKVLVLATEHKSILEPAASLVKLGWVVQTVPVLADGLVDLDVFSSLLDRDTALCCLQLANNETGVLQPVQAIAELAHAVGAMVHTDATQALGKTPVDLESLDVDSASFSSHKIYGPQGIGALYVRTPKVVSPLALGGGQERGLRPGTENIAGAVGFGLASELAARALPDFEVQAARHTQLLWHGLVSALGDVQAIVPTNTPKLPNTLVVRLPGVDADALVAHTPGVAMSTGSACTSMVPGPSHVLMAMLRDAGAASECVRLSTGRDTTDRDIEAATNRVVTSTLRLRELLL